MRWNDGVFVREDGPVGFVDTLDKNARERCAEEAFLTGLVALEKQGRRTNSHKNQANYAPRLMVGLSCCQGLRKNDLERAMNRLFDQGRIHVIEDGSPSHRRSRIVAAENKGAQA